MPAHLELLSYYNNVLCTLEKSQIKIMEEGFRARCKKDSKFIREYAGYVSRLRQEENPVEYVKNVAVMLFPDDEAYNIRMVDTDNGMQTRKSSQKCRAPIQIILRVIQSRTAYG
jgi:hypothetical protein